MKLDVYRSASNKGATLGTLTIDGAFFCYTLEDEIRERYDLPVEQWKVKGATAIPKGTYPLFYRNSPHFGADTLWVQNVRGFDFILIHGGNDAGDTEGCLLVGDQCDKAACTISGGKARGVLAALKAKVLPLLKAGDKVTIEYHNP